MMIEGGAADSAPDTAASLVALGETTLLPPATGPSRPTLAWSLDEPDSAPERRSWRSAARMAAGVLMAAFALAASVIVVRPILTAPIGGQQAATERRVGAWAAAAPLNHPAAAPLAASPDPSPPQEAFSVSPETAQHLQPPAPSADDIYMAQLAQAGIIALDRDGMIRNGHIICADLSRGATDAQLVPVLMANEFNFSVPDAEGMLGAAVTAYCPQYAGQLGHY